MRNLSLLQKRKTANTYLASMPSAMIPAICAVAADVPLNPVIHLFPVEAVT